MTPSPWRNERRSIDCCKDCKPPKRYPGCGDHCPEYKAQKAKHELEKQREREYKKNNPLIKEYDFSKVRMTASRKHK